MLMVHDMMGMMKCSAHSFVKVLGFNRDRERWTD